MAVVMVAALGVAAFRSDSDLWAAAVFTATLFTLAAAVLAAAQRRGTERAFWPGFALFGWGYLVVCYAPWFEQNVQPHLATTRLLREMHERLVGEQPIPHDSFLVRAVLAEAVTEKVQTGRSERVAYIDVDSAVHSEKIAGVRIALDREAPYAAVAQFLLGTRLRLPPVRFERTGHSLMALIVAWLGGVTARAFKGDGRSSLGEA
jgi:hypothetical protein